MARGRISEAGLLVGYAMSRLDRRMITLLDCPNMEAAFDKAAILLRESRSSIRLLRDEFDPFLPNGRRGFVGRPPRPPVAALVHEMQGVSDEALEAMVVDALSGRRTALDAVREIVAAPPERLASVAARLQTGAFAERFFIDRCLALVGVPFDELHDARLDACGYDFSVRGREPVFEVKGLAESQGGLLFTDLEWQTARRLGPAYHLIVVHDIARRPAASLVPDPTARLDARLLTEQRTVVSWQSHFSGR